MRLYLPPSRSCVARTHNMSYQSVFILSLAFSCSVFAFKHLLVVQLPGNVIYAGLTRSSRPR